MASLDPTALIDSIMAAATGILQRDITQMTGFSRNQLELLAQQAQGIAEMQLAGVFQDNEVLKNHFVSQLEAMTRNFVRVLEGLALITAEQLWNAVVKVVWDAIGSATGIALPLPIGGLLGGAVRP